MRGQLLPQISAVGDLNRSISTSGPMVLEAKISPGSISGRIDHLAIDLKRKWLFVAELGNDSLGVVNLMAGKVLRTITGLSKPQGVGYEPITDAVYVANASDGSVRILQLYVQLAYPGRVSDNQLEPDDPRPLMYEPFANRVGHFWFAPEGIGKKLLRAVHLRSYSFYLAFFDDTTPRKEHDFFSEVFISLNSETKLLRASSRKVELVCDGMDAWESFSGSRGNKIATG